ncbi:rhodanese-like domain-containing protein [Thalassotalea sp. HSM 43]|uniref:rhodanese-like domain-containing protein n=1 Tax=Thalassotalea sp. HSM 43 TaxID=2552945 RepID=UPI0010801F44|nr:rhodanese-like domain-containing protein [Thalassotalea sp. HSM 43]QBY03029.1 rhodanese-like domain-containing protein [Thalassotalea sp. HSM 43]
MLKTMPELMTGVYPNIRRISAEQAQLELQQKPGLLVDVREPAECAKGMASDAVNIPRGILEAKLLELVKDATQPIYLHCAAGVRASLAAESIMRLGYQHVTAISCKSDAVISAFS